MPIPRFITHLSFPSYSKANKSLSRNSWTKKDTTRPHRRFIFNSWTRMYVENVEANYLRSDRTQNRDRGRKERQRRLQAKRAEEKSSSGANYVCSPGRPNLLCLFERVSVLKGLVNNIFRAISFQPDLTTTGRRGNNGTLSLPHKQLTINHRRDGRAR